MTITIINGPNLNQIGQREQKWYGTENFDDFLLLLKSKFKELTIQYFQTNIEGEIINIIQQEEAPSSYFIINAGAYSHTSIAIADAIKASEKKFIEIHISNIFQRESFRHHSYLGPVCESSIIGCGLEGYELAIQYLILMNIKSTQ